MTLRTIDDCRAFYAEVADAIKAFGAEWKASRNVLVWDKCAEHELRMRIGQVLSKWEFSGIHINFRYHHEGDPPVQVSMPEIEEMVGRIYAHAPAPQIVLTLKQADQLFPNRS